MLRNLCEFDVSANVRMEVRPMPDEHQYPDRYQPGTHWATDAAWEILDTIKPGVISDAVRAFLAGQIAGRLMMERDTVRSAVAKVTERLLPPAG
jgi:hypothetical protein